jgi:tRNA uridine 5-carboxymethylaminomethyl modification enzyme
MIAQADSFDVIVIGGGHAGCEAASAAARMGAKTALVTHRFSTIGAMSCNPAIGGLGKGHLVREVDALDGLMGRVADAGGIQFRMLNRRKGPAVRGPRAQADRKLYAAAMQAAITQTANLSVVEGEADELIVSDGRATGVRLGDERKFSAGASSSHRHFPSRPDPSRREELAGGPCRRGVAMGLSASFERAGFALGRLKTGTPPRLDGTTIDWSAVEMQPGDDPPEPFSVLTEAITTPQIQCGITRTTPATHEVIRANVHRSPMYSGSIKSTGPRYCPSIEDKIVKFGDRDGHQIFLEPEGLDDSTVYPNGISTSLPEEVQLRSWLRSRVLSGSRWSVRGMRSSMTTSIPGNWIRPCRPGDCRVSSSAGQINGTTGYEEAAAQGIVAGLNAALAASGAAPIVFDRADGYLGVMIDDLVTRGITEPHRMFTSRAEYRLTLRADNADQRLTDKGIALGCVGPERSQYHGAKMGALNAAKSLAKSLTITPNGAARHGLALNRDGNRRSAFELLAYPEVGWTEIRGIWPELSAIDPSIATHLEIDAKYDVYLKRQTADVDAFRRDEALVLTDIDYADVPGLSNEARAKLQAALPRTVGQAGRLDGMTPAALGILAAYLRRQARRKVATASA